MRFQEFFIPSKESETKLTGIFIWEQVGIITKFQTQVHDPYPEHNGEQT